MSKKASQCPSCRNGDVPFSQVLVYSSRLVPSTGSISIYCLLKQHLTTNTLLFPLLSAPRHLSSKLLPATSLFSYPQRCQEPERKVVMVEFGNKASLSISYSSCRDNLNNETLPSQPGSSWKIQRNNSDFRAWLMKNKIYNHRKTCMYTCPKGGRKITSHSFISFLISHDRNEEHVNF